jgi:signal transduction histidine kinase
LAVVRSSIENLEEEGLNPGAQVYAERAREGANRLGAILSALSEASRIETAIQDSEPERCDLRRVIEGCLEGYRDIYRDRVIQEDLASGCAESFSCAPDLIAQLLDKLMENAADFSPPQGWIRCHLDCIPGGVRISVENQGPLLPEHMRERLFDSMVSLRESSGPKLHLGLGLYIARLIAEYHGGNLSAKNLESGEGVRISAVLRERS